MKPRRFLFTAYQHRRLRVTSRRGGRPGRTCCPPTHTHRGANLDSGFAARLASFNPFPPWWQARVDLLLEGRTAEHCPVHHIRIAPPVPGRWRAIRESYQRSLI